MFAVMENLDNDDDYGDNDDNGDVEINRASKSLDKI
jgi:hypothetical protein